MVGAGEAHALPLSHEWRRWLFRFGEQLEEGVDLGSEPSDLGFGGGELGVEGGGLGFEGGGFLGGELGAEGLGLPLGGVEAELPLSGRIDHLADPAISGGGDDAVVVSNAG